MQVTIKEKNVHRAILGIYLIIFQVVIVMGVIAFQADKFATIHGQFKSQTGILGWLVGLVVKHDLYAYIHRRDLVLSLIENGNLASRLDVATFNYKEWCEKDDILWIYGEEEREMFCQLNMGATLFVVAMIGCGAALMLISLAMFKTRSGAWRYFVGMAITAVGIVLVVVYIVVLEMVKAHECVIPDLLRDNFPIATWIMDIFVDMTKLCFSHEEAYMTIEPDESVLIVLLAGIILAVSGIAFPFIMNCFVQKKSTMGRMQKRFKRKKGFTNF